MTGEVEVMGRSGVSVGVLQPGNADMVHSQDSLRLQSGRETSELKHLQVGIWEVFSAMLRI